MLRSCCKNVACKLIIRPCGAGYSAMHPNWSSGCGAILSRPTSRGVSTKPRFEGKSAVGYLYRAVDSAGVTIDFLLSALRDADAAKRLFRKALSNSFHRQPRVIDTD